MSEATPHRALPNPSVQELGGGRAAWGGPGRGRGAERRRRGLRPAQVGAGEPAGAVRGLPGLLAVCCRCGVLRGRAEPALGHRALLGRAGPS